MPEFVPDLVSVVADVKPILENTIQAIQSIEAYVKDRKADATRLGTL